MIRKEAHEQYVKRLQKIALLASSVVFAHREGKRLQFQDSINKLDKELCGNAACNLAALIELRGFEKAFELLAEDDTDAS